MRSILKNNKIYLRSVEPTDLDLLLSWENNSEYWAVSNTLVPFSKEVLRQYVNSAQDVYAIKQVRLLIGETRTNKMVGAVDLFDFEPRHQRAGVGILIDEPFRKKGYAYEAIELVKEYALSIIGVRNLYANILEDNHASIALFKKAHFEKVGHKKNWFNNGQTWLDEITLQCQLIK